MPSTEHEWHDTDQHKQRSDPEPAEGGETTGHKEADPDHGDRELGREQNQSLEEDPTLLPAGEPGRDGGLIGVIDATAVPDGPADARPGGIVKLVLEGKPPLRVASLLNPVVHRAWQRSYSWPGG